MYKRRTDLALEAQELYTQSQRCEPDGVRVTELSRGPISVHRVAVLDERGEQALEKPRGNYVTLSFSPRMLTDRDSFADCARALADELSALLPEEGEVLVVGLGNRAMTPDAIGPLAVREVVVTRHLRAQFPEAFGAMRSTCAVLPGVLGMTGVETAELVRGTVAHVKPAAVIAIDALASRSASRLCSTFQLADTGITPGGGVCNARDALNRETLGVPVIAIGVPTVVDALTLAADMLEEAGIDAMLPERELSVSSLFVTPRDIDAQVAKSARIIGCAVNLALHPDLTLADMEQFLS